jgi:hypothetical protein
VVQENEYNSIIPDNMRDHVSTYYDILFGSGTAPGIPDNIATLNDQGREWWAERYLRANNVYDDVNQYLVLQQQYRATHPQFGQYKDWSSKMRTLKGALGGSLDEYRRIMSQQNPAAARYFEGVVQDLQERGVTPDKWQEELDRATMSSNAWFAIHGQPQSQRDPAATSNVGIGDAMPPMMAPYATTRYNVPQSGPSDEEDWVAAAGQYGL